MAMAGGALLAGVMGMTVVSVFGRYVFGAPIPGDYEITELACGVAVFAFFPYCHIRHGNIVVGFFTSRMRPRRKAMLDTVHNIVFAFVAGLITWRMCVGATAEIRGRRDNHVPGDSALLGLPARTPCEQGC